MYMAPIGLYRTLLYKLWPAPLDAALHRHTPVMSATSICHTAAYRESQPRQAVFTCTVCNWPLQYQNRADQTLQGPLY